MSRRRRQQRLERVLGTPALFSTAYGNVGSSIYYALGVTAVFALGLTPVVFVIAGIIFAATAATYAEGTVRFPEAGGSSSFARHAFNELVSFGAAWAQMLNYIITIAISAFFVPHYLSIFWAPLKENPWDIVGGGLVIAVLVTLNIVGTRESARVNIGLALIDFATQILLVLLGFALIFSPHILASNVHLGVAPTWSQFFIAIPVAMIAYTGIETVSNLAEEARDPVKNIPRAISFVAIAVFAIYFTLPWIALSALPVTQTADGHYHDTAGSRPAGGLLERPGTGPGREHGHPWRAAECAQGVRGASRRDDPLHRDERRRDRRLADHVRDGELPAVAGRLPAATQEIQDAVHLALGLRGSDPDDSCCFRARRTSSGRCTRSGRCSRSPSRMRRWWRCGSRARTTSWSSVPNRTSASAGWTGRSSRSSAGSAPVLPGWSLSCRSRRTRWAGLGWLAAGFVTYAIYRRRLHAPLAETVRAPIPIGPGVALEYRNVLVPIVHRRESEEAVDLACRLATERGATIAAVTVLEVPLELSLDAPLPDAMEHRAHDLLDEARAIGEAYGVDVVGRLIRERRAGRAIVDEAERRNSEIIVMGSPRRDVRRGSARIFGDTVDFVLKNAPCRVMVAAAPKAA